MTAPISKEAPVGDKINHLFDLREQKRALNEQLKELNTEYEALEAEIMAALDEEHTDLFRASRATASISESVVPTVEDWDEFYEYIKHNDALYLLERRPAARAWRELHESGEPVPGTVPFTKRTLNLRKR